MAFIANDSNKKFFNEIKLYTGVSLMKVVGICPTLEELNAVGFNFEKEPVYISEENGVKKVRIDVVFKGDQVLSKAAFFLQDKQRINKNGDKYEIINNYGQSTWAPSVEDALAKIGKGGKKWFKPEGARIALIGEVALINFLRDWVNANPEDQGKIDNYNALFNGNFKELQDYVKTLQKNTIYTLSTVKEGKYQSIYSNYFVRAQFSPETAKTKFSEHLKDQREAGYPLKESYSFNFQEYTGGVIEPDAEIDNTSSSTKVADDIF